MKIDYASLVPKALDALYPNIEDRQVAENKLSTYGKEAHHHEQARVQLGILYLASRDPNQLDSYIELACLNYRDLLVAAEYPLSSHPWDLRQKDPKKYKELQKKEEAEYLNWVKEILKQS